MKELPLCKCGCGTRLKTNRGVWSKGHNRIKPRETKVCACGCGGMIRTKKPGLPSSNFLRGHFQKTLPKREPKLCVCGCGGEVRIDRTVLKGHIPRIKRNPRPVGPAPVCECGCGEVVGTTNYDQEYNKFKRGHHRRKWSNPAAFNKVEAKTFERLSRVYGLSKLAYETMLAEQGGRCAICMTDDPGKANGKATMWAVDHCHKTGKVRGLLCRPCNSGIGIFKDTPSLCNSAAEYLRKHGAEG